MITLFLYLSMCYEILLFTCEINIHKEFVFTDNGL